MIANYTPAVECSMAPSLECYNQLAEKLNLGKSQKNYNIGVLDRICKTGQIGNLEKDSRFNHQNSFVSLDERIRLSYVGKQDGTLLKNALERTIKDTAKRILQTDYAVRGYEPPKQEKKRVEVSPCNYFKFQSYAKARDFKHYDFLLLPRTWEGQPRQLEMHLMAGERSIDDESTIHRIPPAAKGNVQAVPLSKATCRIFICAATSFRQE